MARVLAYVAQHPGCTKGAAAAAAGAPDARAGYRAVDRCIAAGLIMARQIPGPPATAYVLHLTDAGITRREG